MVKITITILICCILSGCALDGAGDWVEPNKHEKAPFVYRYEFSGEHPPENQFVPQIDTVEININGQSNQEDVVSASQSDRNTFGNSMQEQIQINTSRTYGDRR